MIVALALLALVLPSLVLIAWQLERRERSQDRREALASYERDRDAWHRERQLLLNRIKPETAQYVPDPGPVDTPSAPRFDDDAAYWQSTESNEELAERMLRDELQARLASTNGGGE